MEVGEREHIIAFLRGLDFSLTALPPHLLLFQRLGSLTKIKPLLPLVESCSWRPSIGGQYHGSVYATAVREAFIKMEDENRTQFRPQLSGRELDEEQ